MTKSVDGGVLGLKPGLAGWKAQTNPLSYVYVSFILVFNEC